MSAISYRIRDVKPNAALQRVLLSWKEGAEEINQGKRFTSESDTVWVVDKVRELIIREFLRSKERFIVLCNTKKTLLACAVIVKTAENGARLDYLIINPKYQRKGIGTILMRSLQRRFTTLEVTALPRSISFYEKLAFTKSPTGGFLSYDWTQKTLVAQQDLFPLNKILYKLKILH